MGGSVLQLAGDSALADPPPRAVSRCASAASSKHMPRPAAGDPRWPANFTASSLPTLCSVSIDICVGLQRQPAETPDLASTPE